MTSGQNYVGLTEVQAVEQAEREGVFIQIDGRNGIDLTTRFSHDEALPYRIRVHVRGGLIVAAMRG